MGKSDMWKLNGLYLELKTRGARKIISRLYVNFKNLICTSNEEEAPFFPLTFFFCLEQIERLYSLCQKLTLLGYLLTVNPEIKTPNLASFNF